LTKQPINQVNRSEVCIFKSDVAGRNALDTYQRLATKTAIYPGNSTPFGLMYAACGMGGEAGESLNKIKKLFRDDGLIHIGDVEVNDYGQRGAYVTFSEITEEQRLQLKKELGGLLWYIGATANEAGLKLSDIAYGNLDELAGRSERGTLQGSGDNR
jgi:NTP pyrophosphatase (non-canonical NTP hydrolase)